MRGILVPTSGVIVKLTLTISYRLNSVNFKPVASRIFWKQQKACSEINLDCFSIIILGVL